MTVDGCGSGLLPAVHLLLSRAVANATMVTRVAAVAVAWSGFSGFGSEFFSLSLLSLVITGNVLFRYALKDWSS